jgi:hypothetical protein
MNMGNYSTCAATRSTAEFAEIGKFACREFAEISQMGQAVHDER